MTEILQIFSQLLLFCLFTYFPVNKFTFVKFSSNYFNTNYNAFFFNIILILNIFLLLSFFKLNLIIVFVTIFLLNFFLFLLNFSNIIKEIFSKKDINLKLAFIFICLCLFFKTASNLELGWDALSYWLSKANNFYNNKSFFEMPHSASPQLGSYIWAFFWKNSFMQKEYLGRLFLDYLYLISIFAIGLHLKIKSDLKKITFILCLILFTFDYNNTLSGYQEYLLFSLLIFCSKILIELNSRLKKSQNLIHYYLLIMTSILLPWVKNEGIFYSIFIGIVYFFINYQTFSKKIIFLFIILINIIIRILLVKLILETDQIFQFPFSLDIIFQNILNIKELIYRIFYIFFYLIRSMFQYPLILINLISIFFSFKYLKYLDNKKIYYIFFFLNLIFIYGTYIITTSPLVWHLQTSMSRLLLQTCGFYLFLLVDLINKKTIVI
jgi:hypothetical protein